MNIDNSTPPHDPEAELWLLGSLYLQKDLFVDPGCYVDRHDFYEEINGVAYDVIRSLHECGSPMDAVTFGDEMVKRGRTYEDAFRVLTPIAAIPHPAHAPHYATIVRGHAARRRLLQEYAEVGEMIRSPNVQTDEVIARMEDLIRDGSDRRKSRRYVERLSFRQLAEQNQTLNEPVIDGLVRQGETANAIAASKVGKSWLTYGLSLSVITGRPWLGQFETAPGKVLLIDNELHKPTIANRISAVAKAMDLHPEDYQDQLEVWPLRGDMRDLFRLGRDLDRIEPGEFKVIILDAFYRFIPEGTSENDNAQMASLYNTLDKYAERLKSAIVLIHHASKGNQANKAVTDMGAGAGSQSRAADCHLVLREHAEDSAVVLDAKGRSFKPIEPLVLRWEFPLWVPDPEADPTKLKTSKTGQQAQQEVRDDETQNTILDVLEVPLTKSAISRETGFSKARVDRGLVLLTKAGYVEDVDVIVGNTTHKGYRKTLYARDSNRQGDGAF